MRSWVLQQSHGQMSLIMVCARCCCSWIRETFPVTKSGQDAQTGMAMDEHFLKNSAWARHQVRLPDIHPILVLLVEVHSRSRSSHVRAHALLRPPTSLVTLVC